ncbi:hypothetical protein [Lentzea aerocolonigenes]|nr:hypothetical protein [Lentzea aerocolonigenes]
MAKNSDDTSGSAGSEEAKQWPVVGRSLINYDPDTKTSMHPPMGARPVEYAKSGARWPGLVLVLAGLALCVFALAEWFSILVRFLRRPEPPPAFSELLGPVLPIGVSAGVVHVFAFGVGVLLALVGTAMRRTASGVWWQLALAVLLVAVVVLLTIVMLRGAPFSALLPHFSS